MPARGAGHRPLMVPAKEQSSSRRQGPVAVTGATGQVGRALLSRLADEPNEVLEVARGERLDGYVGQAEVVVHLAGGLRPRPPDTYRGSNLETAERTAAAVRGTGVRLVVFMSFARAALSSRNDYLRYKAEAERVVRDCGVPALVLRCNHVFGPPEDPGPTAGALLAHDGTVRILGNGKQLLAPLYRQDLVEVITRAVTDAAAPVGTLELAGPETVSVAHLVRLLNPSPVVVKTTPAPVARLLGRFLPELNPVLVDVLLGDAAPSEDVAANASRFGVRLHRVAEIWPQADPG